MQKEFLTRPLWGVGSKVAFGHDGRSINLTEVILRHGGEAQEAADAFAALDDRKQQAAPGVPATRWCSFRRTTRRRTWTRRPHAPSFPQFGHGSIKLTVLFNDPADKE